MTTPTPSAVDKRAAEKLTESFDVGCPTPELGFIHANVDKIAELIATAMQPEREAHRKAVEAFGVYGSHMVACAVENNQPCTCGFDKALAAIEKVTG